jgi:hypothetical protein
MKGNKRSHRSSKLSFPKTAPIGTGEGNEKRSIVFGELKDAQIRAKFAGRVYPEATKAIKEAMKAGEEVTLENVKIRNAFILDEIAMHGVPIESLQPSLFKQATKATRRKARLDPLDLLLFDGVMNRGWHQFSASKIIGILWKDKGIRDTMKRKPSKSLIRSRLDRLDLPMKTEWQNN